MSRTKSKMIDELEDNLVESADGHSGNIETLRDFKLFKGLTKPILEIIADASDFKSYITGETIVSHGQYDGDEFIIVAKGALQISIINPDTGAMIMETVEEGKSFGLDMILADNGSEYARSITLTAASDCDIWMVDGFSFREIVSNRPSLTKNILFYLATEFVQSRFKSFEFSEAPEQKIYSLLLSYVERDEVSGEWRIENMPKHRELAEAVGVEEVDAADAVALLIQNGIVRRNYPGLIVDDMTRLDQLSR